MQAATEEAPRAYVHRSRWERPDGSVVEGWRAWVGGHYIGGYFATQAAAEAAIEDHNPRRCPVCRGVGEAEHS